MRSIGFEVVQSDLLRAPLSDPRLRLRAGAIAGRIARHPDRGLPRLLGASELEGAYRFVNNGRVRHEVILEGHVQGTLERAAVHPRTLAIHDTTAFAFGGDVPREGLGLDNGGRGFSAHFSLLATADSARQPLGVAGVEPIFRLKRKHSERRQRARYLSADKESLRWVRMVDQVDSRFGEATDLVHVMDSEADWYDLLDHLVLGTHRFVVRLTHPRVLLDSRGRRLQSTPSELLDRVCAVAEREVALSARTGKGKPLNSKKKHPPRKKRIARLEIAARSITIACPARGAASSDSITLNVVQVREIDPPQDCEPIEWLLGTSEPVDSVEAALAVVDYYRARWLIEDFFKALKTGCAYEKRQFESKHALLNMLALLVPVAWMLLAVRAAIHRDSKEPGSRLLSTRQLAVLRAAVQQRTGNDVLGENPTERDVGYGIALLGGYTNKSRPPGWLILGRGYEDLLIMEAGWALARGHRRPAPSPPG